MPNDSADSLVHCSKCLLSVPLLPRQVLGIHTTDSTTETMRQNQACLVLIKFSLTFNPEDIFLLISSKNCIFKMTRGSILGGKGRPVMITPRPKVSAKSRPSLAWQKILNDMLWEGTTHVKCDVKNTNSLLDRLSMKPEWLPVNYLFIFYCEVVMLRSQYLSTMGIMGPYLPTVLGFEGLVIHHM